MCNREFRIMFVIIDMPSIAYVLYNKCINRSYRFEIKVENCTAMCQSENKTAYYATCDLSYSKCNIPIKPHVRLLVGWSVIIF